MSSNIDLFVNTYVGEKLTSLQLDMPVAKKNYGWAHEQVTDSLVVDIKHIKDYFQQVRDWVRDESQDNKERLRVWYNVILYGNKEWEYVVFKNIYDKLENIDLLPGFLIEDIKDMCPELVEPYKEILTEEQINTAFLDFYIAQLDDAVFGYVFGDQGSLIDIVKNKPFDDAMNPIKTLLELVNSDQLKQHEFYEELKRHFEIQEYFSQTN